MRVFAFGFGCYVAGILVMTDVSLWFLVPFVIIVGLLTPRVA